MLDNEDDPGYLEALEAEFGIDPVKAYPPIPAKLFATMVRNKIITLPVTPEQEGILKAMQWIWKDKDLTFLRSVLSSFTPKRREKLAEMPRLSAHERSIVTMFMQTGEEYVVKGEVLLRKAPLITEIQSLVKSTSHYNISTEKVKQLRQIAYDYKRKGASAKGRAILSEQQPVVEAPAAAAVIKSDVSIYLSRMILDSFGKGLSVIEISRLTGIKASQVYGKLVNWNAIKPLPKEGKNIDTTDTPLDTEWALVLASHGLSFGQWCQGWGFYQADVLAVLSKRTDRTINQYRKIRIAVGRDMPERYHSEFHEAAIHTMQTGETKKVPEFNTQWNTTENRYISIAVGLDGNDGKMISGHGETASEATASADEAATECIQSRNLMQGVDIVKLWER